MFYDKLTISFTIVVLIATSHTITCLQRSFESGITSEITKQLISAVEQENSDLVAELIQKKADVNVRDSKNYNETLLMKAKFNIPIAQLLINANIGINAQSTGGHTALYLAALVRESNFMQMLLDNNADPNIVNNNGESPLMEYILYKNPVKLLITHKANVNAINCKKETPLLKLLNYSEPIDLDEIAALLVTHGAHCTTHSVRKLLSKHGDKAPKTRVLVLPKLIAEDMPLPYDLIKIVTEYVSPETEYPLPKKEPNKITVRHGSSCSLMHLVAYAYVS